MKRPLDSNFKLQHPAGFKFMRQQDWVGVSNVAGEEGRKKDDATRRKKERHPDDVEGYPVDPVDPGGVDTGVHIGGRW